MIARTGPCCAELNHRMTDPQPFQSVFRAATTLDALRYVVTVDEDRNRIKVPYNFSSRRELIVGRSPSRHGELDRLERKMKSGRARVDGNCMLGATYRRNLLELSSHRSVVNQPDRRHVTTSSNLTLGDAWTKNGTFMSLRSYD